LTIYASYDVLSCTDMPFRGPINTASHLEGEILQKLAKAGGVNRHFQTKLQNINNCILSKLLN